jgi:hypothetical protein
VGEERAHGRACDQGELPLEQHGRPIWGIDLASFNASGSTVAGTIASRTPSNLTSGRSGPLNKLHRRRQLCERSLARDAAEDGAKGNEETVLLSCSHRRTLIRTN